MKVVLEIEIDPAEVKNLREALLGLRGYTREAGALEGCLHEAHIVYGGARGSIPREGVMEALRTYGSAAAAARALGVPRSTLRDTVSRYKRNGQE